MRLKHYVGVDVSKKTLDFALCEQGKIILRVQCENDKRSIGKVIKELRKVPGFALTGSLFCMEHTGIYCYHLLDFLFASKANIWLETAVRIKKSQGLTRGKDDKIDAGRIAQYAYTFRGQVQLWQPAREEIKKLRHLIIMRERLVNGTKQLNTPLEENKNFLDKSLAKLEKKAFKSTLQAMKKDLQGIEQQIDELIDSDATLKQLFRLITSIDGVGKITAINMIAVTNEFKDFNEAKKFACYCGVAPFPHQSGTSIRGRTRVSHFANKKIKTLFHLGAMAAINMKGKLQNYYTRKISEGKNKMSVLNAIRNKIIHRIFAVIKR